MNGGALIALLAGAAVLAALGSNRRKPGIYAAALDPIALQLLEPWRWAAVPRCIAERLPGAARFEGSSSYWSTHITGDWPCTAVGAWLKSQGVSPASRLQTAPTDIWDAQWVREVPGYNSSGAHTWLKSDGAHWPARWALSAELQAEWERRAERAAREYGYSEGTLLTNGPQAMMPGDSFGLSVFPPLAFHSQEHLDAWLAHYQCWRYGYSYPSSPDGTEHGFRSLITGWEIEPPDNAIAQLYAATVAKWPQVETDEEIRPAFLYGYAEVLFRRLKLGQADLMQQTMAAYLLLCCQLAYLGILPGADRLPRMLTVGESFSKWMKQYGVAIVASAATGNYAGAAAAAAKSLTATFTAATSAVKWSDRTPPEWEPVPIPLSELAISWPMPPAQKGAVTDAAAAVIRAHFGG